MYLKSDVTNCDNCFKPAGRRLGLFRARDDYACYAESYVKCFWGMCDKQHISQESLLAKTEAGIITVQPKHQGLQCTTAT